MMKKLRARNVTFWKSPFTRNEIGILTIAIFLIGVIIGAFL